MDYFEVLLYLYPQQTKPLAFVYDHLSELSQFPEKFLHVKFEGFIFIFFIAESMQNFMCFLCELYVSLF